MLGKAQRYVADVKAEVNRSIELEELKKMKDTVETAARDVESSIQAGASEFEKQWSEATDHRAVAALAEPPPPIPNTGIREEVAHQAGRHAQLVQGAQRHPHQGAVRRGPGGPVPPA